MKNCIHTSKLGLWVECFGEFDGGHYYWYTSIESKAIWKFKKFGWKFIIYIYKSKGKIFYVFKKNQYQMKEKEIL